MKKLRVRRWCDTCQRFTESEMVDGEEICAEHRPPVDEDEW